uniref:PiggyBac transposable element-derived protein domain-containing protein n=1 Tax=Sander lucioperca TaxID=283035 RepID=A0A8D0A246_SANLU
MDAKSFYGSRPWNFLALVPEDPQDSEADLSDDDDDDDDDDDIIGDPDYLPKQAEMIRDLSTESDEEEMPSTSTSAKRKIKGRKTLKIAMEELDVAPMSPPFTKKKKMAEKKDKEARRIWKHVDIEEFQVPDSSFAPPDAVKTPFQYFKRLFTDEMIQHIAHQTNLYSVQELGDLIKTNPGEIEDFLAMLLLMGVFDFPAMEDYWHPASRFNMIADIMPQKRFKQLRHYIHFNDNQQCDGSPDRFYKIRPLFEMLRKQCLLIPSTYKHSVDEVMVSYKGTRAGNLRQYIANKPDKWGFKVFCRASSSGIIHDLLLYQGPKSRTHLIEDKELMERGRGALDYKSAEGVLTVKWYDNKCVTLLSNACGIMPLTSVQRWSKDEKAKIAVPCPSLIAAYNQHMGGIDLSDMLVHLYKTPAKSRRWYFPLFGYVLDLCISNAWLVYKRDCGLLKEKPMPLKRFHLAVAHSLKQKCLPPRPPQPQPDVRYDNYGHLPLHTDNRGRCCLCPKGVSRWKCGKCNVFLCLIEEREYYTQQS